MPVDPDHCLKITSIQEYHGAVYPSLLVDGGFAEHMDLTFHKEVELVFECDCGLEFHNQSAAEAHLRDVAGD